MENYFRRRSFTKLFSMSANRQLFKRIIGVGNGDNIYFWKSKELYDERINSITAPNYSITPSLDYIGAKIRGTFNESCLKQNNLHIIMEK